MYIGLVLREVTPTSTKEWVMLYLSVKDVIRLSSRNLGIFNMIEMKRVGRR